MHLRPPVEMARCRLIAQLHEWINTVTGLPRIQSSRYQVTGWDKGGYHELCMYVVLEMYPIPILSSSPHFFFLLLFSPFFFPILLPPPFLSPLSFHLSPLPTPSTRLGWLG